MPSRIQHSHVRVRLWLPRLVALTRDRSCLPPAFFPTCCSRREQFYALAMALDRDRHKVSLSLPRLAFFELASTIGRRSFCAWLEDGIHLAHSSKTKLFYHDRFGQGEPYDACPVSRLRAAPSPGYHRRNLTYPVIDRGWPCHSTPHRGRGLCPRPSALPLGSLSLRRLRGSAVLSWL